MQWRPARHSRSLPRTPSCRECRCPSFGRTYFLLLELLDPSGATRSRSFYWLSSEPDVIDYEKANHYLAPLKGHASFHALAELPEATLDLERLNGAAPGELRLRVTLAPSLGQSGSRRVVAR